MPSQATLRSGFGGCKLQPRSRLRLCHKATNAAATQFQREIAADALVSRLLVPLLKLATRGQWRRSDLLFHASRWDERTLLMQLLTRENLPSTSA